MAVFMVVLGGLILGFQDAFVKASSDYTSYWQFLTIRSVLNFTFVVLFCLAFLSPKSLVPENLIFVIIRSICVGVCMLCFFSGAVTLDFSLMVAGLYTYPIFVTIMATFILGEKLDIGRIFGIILGIIGSLFILEPWRSEVSYVQILPIFAGFFYACNIIIIKKFCPKENPLALEIVRALVFILIGIAGIIFAEAFLPKSIKSDLSFISSGWPELTLFIVTICMIASACNLLGNLFIIKGYQSADGSLLAPFDFLYLVFAVLWGKVILQTWPSMFDFFGIAFILSAGVVSSLEILNFKQQQPQNFDKNHR